MGAFFRRIFNIYPGEERRACLFAILAFVWSLGNACGVKFADALFLINIGADSLPIAYSLTACGILTAALFLLYAFHVISPYRIFMTTVLSSAAFYGGAYLFLSAGYGLQSPVLWYSLKIAGDIFYSILVTCFWSFVDEYYHLQDAKRLFSLFNTAIFAAFASTGFLMRLGTLDLHSLMIFILVLLLISAYLVFYIGTHVPVVHDDTVQESGVVEEERSFKYLFKSVLTSRFTLLLVVSSFITQVMAVITEYNYMSSFQHYFQSTVELGAENATEAKLTLFLGECIGFVSIANLIFGLFVYSRLVRRFGISNIILSTPVILLCAFTGWMFSTSLVFPLIGFLAVEGTLYVIDDSSFTLLLNGVPSKLKNKIRVMIESFFEPIALLFGASLLTFATIDSKLLGLVIVSFSLIVMLALRSEYLQALFRNLADNAVHFQRNVQDWLGFMNSKEQKNAEHRLLAILKSGDEKGQIFACEGLIAFEDVTILQKFLQYADELSVPAKIKFMELIGESPFFADSLVLDHMQSWIVGDHDPQLKGAVNFYLAKQGLLHPEKAVDDLESEDPMLVGAAIVALNSSMAHQSPTAAAFNRTLAAQHLEKLLHAQSEDHICMGLTVLGVEAIPGNVDMLLPFLKHTNLKVARTAAISIAQIIDKQSMRCVPLLISQLTASSDNEFRLACLKALGKVADSFLVKNILEASIHFRASERRMTELIILKMGLRTVPALLAVTKDTTMHDRCRMLAGRTLGRLSLPQLHAHLYDIIRVEIERAYFYFYHQHVIQQQYPDLDLSSLQDALQTGFHSVIDFIIQLLGAAGSIEDCELLSRSLRSRNLKMRAQVVETLEKTCDTQIFRLLQPLVSELPLEEKLRAYLKGKRKPLSLTELLDKMDKSASQADRIIAATLKYRLDLPNWRASLRQQMSSKEELFHHFAYELLET